MNGFKKKSRIFKNLNIFAKLKTFKTHFFIFIIHKPFLWSRNVPHKFGPDQFNRFDVYRILTDRQTPRQAKFIYRFKAVQLQMDQNPLFI